jgi:glutamate-1-semialdehyde 2,1-aminomutase
MMAIRLARAVTGRDSVMRFAQAYHGTYDAVQDPTARGLSSARAREIVAVPFNDGSAALDAMRVHGESLAAVVLDAMPNRAGLVPASPEFVRMLRAETRARGIVLIQDEVLTFRMTVGGLHKCYDVEPDVITVGKLIGGGFPVGAFGGAPAIMSAFDPRTEEPVLHGGTFSANPVTMSAGCAALSLYDAVEVERLNALGDRLRSLLLEDGWSVTGRGSLLRVHAPDQPRLWWSLYRSGVLIAPNGLMALSTPMDEEVINELGRRFEQARTQQNT